ncbi:hypothetical protein [Micromonospora sp. NPDC005206]|uniref:hypothetical protein n=1 Tax=Micromonospora sp. NPDC005206 TaxID=3157022 RepID=UPI00339E0F90
MVNLDIALSQDLLHALVGSGQFDSGWLYVLRTLIGYERTSPACEAELPVLTLSGAPKSSPSRKAWPEG